MKATVIRSSRNLFTVTTDEINEIECRIKGKVLKSTLDYYNPIAPGDVVDIEDGLIVGLEDRKNVFARFNQKGQAPQLLAANVDLVLCVSSLVSPPFRPRFIDRVLLQADAANIKAVIICNKSDLVEDESAINADSELLDTEERLSDFQRIGFTVLRISAATGQGMDDFKRLIAGKFSVLVGQSGVGKSSIINALTPSLNIKTGAVNEKFNRGNHTTTQAALLCVPLSDPANALAGNTRIIDTPGVRRFAPAGILPDEVILYMREFAPLAGKCSYGLSCSHETEPGCKIMEAVAAGEIHEDRYDSFLRIRDDLSDKRAYPDND